MTVSTWRVLAVLADRGTCSFSELVGLTSTRAGHAVAFRRQPDQRRAGAAQRSTADARAVEITLTEAGEAKFTETLPWGLDVENKLTRGLSPSDILRLKRMLNVCSPTSTAKS